MRIAIVGGGVAGLVAAHRLHDRHEITLFEAGDHLGGHANTVAVERASGSWALDTGFIVLNDRNYPRLRELLASCGVALAPTHMGFSVSAQDEDFEYAGTPRGVFCQPANLARPAFWRMLADLLRFNRELAALARGPAGEGDEQRSLARVRTRRRLLALVHRASDRPPGLGRVVGGPGGDVELPGALPRRVLRQPRHARVPRPPALAGGRRGLAALRGGGQPTVRQARAPRDRGALDQPRRGRRDGAPGRRASGALRRGDPRLPRRPGARAAGGPRPG